MPSGAVAKRLVLASGLALAVLLIVGFVVGAIGSAMFGREAPFVSKPEIHLPPQPIFPASVRDQQLGLTPDAEKGAEKAAGHGESAKETSGHEEAAAKEEEHHVEPVPVTRFTVTNTLLSAWFATLVLVLFFVLGARKKSLVPGRFQGLIEILVEGAYSACSGVVGPEMARKTFPIIATIFFFVLFNAWLALLPFYQFLGFVQDGELKAHSAPVCGHRPQHAVGAGPDFIRLCGILGIPGARGRLPEKILRPGQPVPAAAFRLDRRLCRFPGADK